jgi:hypothetical protein
VVLRTGDLLNRLLAAASPWWWGFKYNDIEREQGTYRASPLRYRPYLARHEPPQATTTNRRARIVYDRVMAAKDERVAEISRTLAQSGREPVPDPQFWDGVGNWMIEAVEGSREPGSDRFHPYIQDYSGSGRPPAQIGGESTTVLRPLWESIVLDLSFLLGEHMITRLKTACWGFDGERHQGSCAGDPRVVMMAERRSDETSPMEMPFRSIGSAARYCLQRRQGLFGRNLEPFRLGDTLRRIIDTDDRPKPYNAREEFIASLEVYLAEHGDLPPNDEIVQWMVEARMSHVPELPSQLTAILDERDRREGRTGKASWRAT